MPMWRSVFMMRTAISPRLAMRTLLNIRGLPSSYEHGTVSLPKRGRKTMGGPPVQTYTFGPPEITTRIGVGLNPLQGLLTWGQLEMTQRTSISARSSTWSPGAERPSTMVICPEGWIGTFMKKLMLGTISRLDMQCLVTSSTKLSRQACRYLVSWPKRTVLLSHEQAPAEVSWRPQLSAVTVSMT